MNAVALNADTDVSPTRANEVIERAIPLNVELKIVRDVLPFDNDLAVELRGRCRTADDEAHLVRIAAADHCASRKRRCRVAIRHALHEELFFDVASIVWQQVRREERITVRRITGWRRRRNRSNDGRIVDRERSGNDEQARNE